MSGVTTAADVAAWMVSELDGLTYLYQDEAVHKIAERFGVEFTYENANGNLAISRPVLDAFNELTGKGVVWSQSERFWRRRQPGDLPGRQQP